MTMPPALVEQLFDWIHAHQPNRQLLVAHFGHPLRAALDKMQSTTIHMHPAQAVAEGASSAAVYDLAIVCDTLETQDKRDVQRLMSRLRDVQARAVIVATAPPSAITPDANAWMRIDFIALGFKRCRAITSADGWQIYRFNIYDYKDTPTWLNARHWANPAQWGRHRW